MFSDGSNQAEDLQPDWIKVQVLESGKTKKNLIVILVKATDKNLMQSRSQIHLSVLWKWVLGSHV